MQETGNALMPYGYPWELTREPKGYRCPYYNKSNRGPYQPFCGQCGKKLPAQNRLVLTGYAIQHDNIIGIGRNIAEINSALLELGQVEIWLQMYLASHRETDIRFRLPNGRFDGDYSLICSSTIRICLPVDNGWTGQLSISAQDNKYRLTDETADALVACGGIALFQYVF